MSKKHEVRWDYETFGEYLWDRKGAWLPSSFSVTLAVFYLFLDVPGWVKGLMAFGILMGLALFGLLAHTFYFLIRPYQRSVTETIEILTLKAIEFEQIINNYSYSSPERDQAAHNAKTCREFAEILRKSITPRRVVAMSQE